MEGTPDGYRAQARYDILNVCLNLVTLDLELNAFRFAHLSVREYFEQLPEYDLVTLHSRALGPAFPTTSTH